MSVREEKLAELRRVLEPIVRFSPELRGVRYAPSPTGILHIGNLRTAWISYQISRALDQPWIVRFEDIDTPRVVKGSQRQQTADFLALGLKPDEIHTQSESYERHVAAFETALAQKRIYACTCSRRELQEALAQAASAPHVRPAAYNGKCRSGTEKIPKTDLPKLAWRWRGDDETGAEDVIIGRTLPSGAEFQPSYTWACAVDDSFGKYSILVRAWDLSHVEVEQKKIARWLNPKQSLAHVFHTALVITDDGRRLEKRTLGVKLAEWITARGSISSITQKLSESLKDFSAAGENAREIKLSSL